MFISSHNPENSYPLNEPHKYHAKDTVILLQAAENTIASLEQSLAYWKDLVRRIKSPHHHSKEHSKSRHRSQQRMAKPPPQVNDEQVMMPSSPFDQMGPFIADPFMKPRPHLSSPYYYNDEFPDF